LGEEGVAGGRGGGRGGGRRRGSCCSSGGVGEDHLKAGHATVPVGLLNDVLEVDMRLFFVRPYRIIVPRSAVTFSSSSSSSSSLSGAAQARKEGKQVPLQLDRPTVQVLSLVKGGGR
jgi:hypothetical protein